MFTRGFVRSTDVAQRNPFVFFVGFVVRKRLRAAVTLGAILVATSLFAQTPTGTILGSIKDSQGAVIPGATVTATNLGTDYSRTAVTDGAGEYALRLLPIGGWTSCPKITNVCSVSIRTIVR